MSCNFCFSHDQLEHIVDRVSCNFCFSHDQLEHIVDRESCNFYFSHDQLEHIVDRVVAEADSNEDGFISFQEFQEAISKIDIEQKMAFIGFK